MDFAAYLKQKNLTRYQFSQLSGIPITKISDLCANPSKIERYTAKTVFRIAKALDCTMEEVMMMGCPDADAEPAPAPDSNTNPKS
jgi:plasmid maintenance system antidote protein VapI